MSTRTISRAVALLAAFLLIPVHTAVADDGTVLGTAAVEELLVGNTIVGESLLTRFRNRSDRHFEVYVEPDGGLVIRNFIGDLDTGIWEITGEGGFCNQYRQTRRGMRRCYTVAPASAAGSYHLIDSGTGSASTAFTVRAGRPGWLNGK